MLQTNQSSKDSWPELSYPAFADTAYLMHRASQVIGKFKLHTPFEPHWSNVALWLTGQGLTTGPIPYKKGIFCIDMNFIDHAITLTTSWGGKDSFALQPMSVADFTKKLFNLLREQQIDLHINLMPQEVPNPISFDKDQTVRPYDTQLVNAWWCILVNSYKVLQRYHARFKGETPSIGFMWGTFDLRDARYNGTAVPATGINASYIRRNAMDEAQVEAGWWAGSDAYPRPAYYSFTYPQPNQIEKANILPSKAHWDDNLKEFILDYDDLRKSVDPEKDLLSFFESTYAAGAKCANWKKELIGTGEPV